MKRKLTKKDIGVVKQVRSTLQSSIERLDVLLQELDAFYVQTKASGRMAFRTPSSLTPINSTQIAVGRRGRPGRKPKLASSSIEPSKLGSLSILEYQPYLAMAFESHPEGITFKEAEKFVENQVGHLFTTDDTRLVARTNRQRWLYQLSSLKGRLLKMGMMKKIGTDKNQQPIYSMGKRDIQRLRRN